MSDAPLRYLVRRLNWRRVEACWARLPGAPRVTSHADAESAERERGQLEAEARQVINPFLCGRSLSERTRLDAGRLHDWALDLGLAPPDATEGKPANWAEWWER